MLHKNNIIFLIRVNSVKPRIDRTNLKNIVVRGGKTVKYNVNIKGEPAPTVKWQLVNKEVCAIIIFVCFIQYNS